MNTDTETAQGAASGRACAQCGGAIPADKRKGTVFCSPACYNRNYGTRYQRNRRKAGICHECDQPVMRGKTRCRACRDKRRKPKGEVGNAAA